MFELLHFLAIIRYNDNSPVEVVHHISLLNLLCAMLIVCPLLLATKLAIIWLTADAEIAVRTKKVKRSKRKRSKRRRSSFDEEED